MRTIEKINQILKKTNISKVNLAKYLGVSRQMVYNYLDCDSLDKWPKDKKMLLFNLLEVRDAAELENIVVDDEYIEKIENKLYTTKKNSAKKENCIISLDGFKKEEQDVINDIVFLLKEMLNEDKTKTSLTIITYIYHFIQSMVNTKELKYMLAYVVKSAGFVKPTVYEFEEEYQFIFESIMYSAMTLYNNGGASRSRLMDSHRKWEAEIEQKNEEKMSRTQELNSAKVQALKELGYTEINEKNAGEVFDKIAEIQSRKI